MPSFLFFFLHALQQNLTLFTSPVFHLFNAFLYESVTSILAFSVASSIFQPFHLLLAPSRHPFVYHVQHFHFPQLKLPSLYWKNKSCAMFSLTDYFAFQRDVLLQDDEMLVKFMYSIELISREINSGTVIKNLNNILLSIIIR